MKTTASRRPAAPALLLAALLAAFLVLLFPTPASAHDELVSSSPEAGSTVDQFPAEIVLIFSAELISGGNATEVQVLDAAGELVTEGDAVTAGTTVTQPLSTDGGAGDYRVLWRVVSSDGHPTDGEFTFTAAAGSSAGAVPTPATSSAPPATTEATATPTSSATTAPPSASDEADNPAAPALVWVLAIIGALVVAAAVTAVVVRSKRRGHPGPAADSDAPSAR